MVKISFVIPIYNVEKYIVKCIESCTNQDLLSAEYEIICVNDGTPDRSAVIAHELAEKHQNVRVIDRENGGLSAARNTGLRNAKGDYIFFLDSDDWIKDNCLATIYRRCKEGKLDMLRICAANMIGNEPRRRFSYNNEGEVLVGKEILRKGISFCAPFSIYRRQFLLDNDLWFYEGIYHEDNEFTPRAFFKAERVGAMNDLIYFVYQNPDSITRSFNPKKAFDFIKVMESLHKFQQREDPGKNNAFNYVITGTLNAALHEAVEFDDKTKKEFETTLYSYRDIYNHLFNTGHFIYTIEGLLMKMFPKHSVGVYKFMNLFDRRGIKKDKNK